ncbi:MAG: hypothetical protein BWX90_01014 [bacterium ADurb.Bin132]|nr:MAG: hypothetical protein BWX90_01014 [bacterium ADurb.Bin132]
MDFWIIMAMVLAIALTLVGVIYTIVNWGKE